MSGFLTAMAAVVLLACLAGVVALARSRAAADAVIPVQLLGTGGVAVLLLLAAATGDAAVLDVALMLALLAAVACIAFHGASPGGGAGR